jgi:hypothetical protein
MTRDDEVHAIEAWLARHKVKRARPAYAVPSDAAPPPDEQRRRLAALQLRDLTREDVHRLLWAELQSPQRAAKG